MIFSLAIAVAFYMAVLSSVPVFFFRRRGQTEGFIRASVFPQVNAPT